MKRIFIELPAFSRLIKEGRITDAQLKSVQHDILEGGGEVMQRTGGVSKIRCGGLGAGKSGGWRVLFAEYPGAGIVVMIWAFPKNKQANLNDAEKTEIRKLKQELDEQIRNIRGKHGKGR